ncbi:MAG: hypothetical protein D3908_17125, partial [Candidatus Electrothrix sp. AUS4]|nr:hypothetical protein [Candidatus Electrothrix sp. AUS4]
CVWCVWCWWLKVLVPVAVICFYALSAEGISFFFVETIASPFRWWVSMSFLLGWLIGMLIIRAVKNKTGETSVLLLFIATTALGMASLSLLSYDSPIYEAAVWVIIGIWGGVSLNVFSSTYLVLTYGVIGGILFSIPLEWQLNIPLIILVNAILCVAFSTESSGMIERLIWLATGIAMGIVVGVTNGMIFGVAGGVSYILGVLRFYFWLPELLWMFLLASWPAKATVKLSWLPPHFDQVIIFPLPFLPGLIAEAYQENRAAARQTINYLIFSTEQQKSAWRAISLIAAEECHRCQTVRDIASLPEELAWLSEQPSPGLAACLNISQDVTAALEAS